MALQLIVDSLDAVPEPLRGNYKEADGKFRLDLDGYEDPVGLKSALQKERDRANAAERQAKPWLSVGKTPEEIQALLEAQRKADEDKLKGAGEWDKLKAQMNEQTARERAALEDRLKAKDKAIEQYLIDAQATTAITELKGVPALLLPHVKAATRVVEADGQFHTRVIDAAGNPRVNSKGEFLSIKDLVSEMRQSEVFGRAFEATGTSGGGAQGGQPVTGKTMTVAAFNALKPAEQAGVMAKGVQLVD